MKLNISLPKTSLLLAPFLACIWLYPQAGFSQSPGCVTPPSGLVSWWSGDGNATDIVDANDGTLQNGATVATGLVEQAFSFDGVNDFVQVSDATNLDIRNEITIYAWIKPTAQQLGCIAAKFSFSPRTGYGIFFRGDRGGLVHGFIGKGDIFSRVVSNSVIP